MDNGNSRKNRLNYAILKSSMSKIPKHLQGILWSVDINQLDLDRDKSYIMHQVLKYGSFADISWLFKTYSKKDVTQTFIEKPSKTYPKSVFHFIKNYVLSLKDIKLNEDAYTTSISGPVKPRALDQYLKKCPNSVLSLKYK